MGVKLHQEVKVIYKNPGGQHMVLKTKYQVWSEEVLPGMLVNALARGRGTARAMGATEGTEQRCC